jgi:hypothetical protein
VAVTLRSNFQGSRRSRRHWARSVHVLVLPGAQVPPVGRRPPNATALSQMYLLHAVSIARSRTQVPNVHWPGCITSTHLEYIRKARGRPFRSAGLEHCARPATLSNPDRQWQQSKRILPYSNAASGNGIALRRYAPHCILTRPSPYPAYPTSRKFNGDLFIETIPYFILKRRTYTADSTGSCATGSSATI